MEKKEFLLSEVEKIGIELTDKQVEQFLKYLPGENLTVKQSVL